MSVNFVISGQKTFVEKLPDGVRNLSLKAKLYSLDYSRDEGFFLLDIAGKYIIPDKTYGNYKDAAARIIKTHYSKNGNTGVLLTGLKGTGKSLFVKFIANAMIDGDEIFNFIENIGNCVLLFDEFGKNYSVYNNQGTASQVGLLSLLDGLGNSKRLHLFTENNVASISEYLINRPGRVHYHFKYDRLNDDIIKEYCKDLEIPESIVEEVLATSTKLKVLSFDTISCLINEWKLYGGKLDDHLNILNLTLCRDPDNENIKVLYFIREDGTDIPSKDIKIDYRDNYICIVLNTTKNGLPQIEHLDPFRTEDAIFVKNDVYKFVTTSGDKISLKIKSVRY